MAQFIPRLQKKHIRKALRAGAKIVKQDGEALTPEDEGLLALSWRVRARRRSRTRLGVDIIVGSDEIDQDSPYYALFVEFGHMAKDGSFVEPQPFARPALWDNAVRIQRLFLTILREGLRQLARELYPNRRII